MDHATAREVLELAAVEPDGLERLMAGDTAEAAALAGHLAGCDFCSEEMVRLRRTAILLRDVVGTTPTRELRGRTLDYVRAVGRPRGAVAATPGGQSSDSGTPELVVDAARPAGASASVGEARRGRLGPGPSFGLPRAAAWAASLAAAVIVSVALTGILFVGPRDATIQNQNEALGDLASLTAWTLRLDGAPDARRVALASATGGPANGLVVFSPSSRDVIIVATGLPQPAAGQEYRCWLNSNGQQQRIGHMQLAAGLEYWVGKVDVVAGAAPGSTFGVTLVDQAGAPVTGQPVLTGTL